MRIEELLSFQRCSVGLPTQPKETFALVAFAVPYQRRDLQAFGDAQNVHTALHTNNKSARNLAKPLQQTMNPARPVHSASQDGRNFPTKLHQCLTELECEGLGHIASFQPHGRCFLVHKQEEFVRQVLPR
jgi:hypothetical protein